MNLKEKSTQTLLFEWVKDGNEQSLKDYLRQITQFELTFIFQIRDSLQRTVIHWAAYLGQSYLLEWWLSEYKQLILIDQEDDQQYTPLELGIIRGFNNEYNQELQFKTIAVLIDHGASLRQKNTKMATPLHWAFYYGNIEMITFMMNKCWQILFSIDENGYYPIDYLFFEKKNQLFRENNEQVFTTVVQKYIDGNQQVKTRLEFAVQRNSPQVQINSMQEKIQINQNQEFENDANFIPDPDPTNINNPNSYNFKPIRLEIFPQNNRKVHSNQISNIIEKSSSQNQLHAESQRSEPEEEKLPQFEMLQVKQRTSLKKFSFTPKNFVFYKKKLHFRYHFFRMNPNYPAS